MQNFDHSIKGYMIVISSNGPVPFVDSYEVDTPSAVLYYF